MQNEPNPHTKKSLTNSKLDFGFDIMIENDLLILNILPFQRSTNIERVIAKVFPGIQVKNLANIRVKVKILKSNR